MATLRAHRLSVDLPRGWDGQIYVRDLPDHLLDDLTLSTTPSATYPILHASNVALPATRGDFGGTALEAMGPGGVFVAVLEAAPADAATAVYQHPVPWPLDPDDLRPEQMQRGIPGGAGCQRFFTAGQRGFCLYVAIGSHAQRRILVREANRVLTTVTIDPR